MRDFRVTITKELLDFCAPEVVKMVYKNIEKSVTFPSMHYYTMVLNDSMLRLHFVELGKGTFDYIKRMKLLLDRQQLEIYNEPYP